MTNRSLTVRVILGLALCASPLVAQDQAAAPDDPRTQALPSAALPFVAIKPCRLVDTRDGAFPAGYGPPALGAGVVRVITFPGRCGIPAAIEAVSANLTVVNTQGPGFVTTFPGGTSLPSPLVSSLNYSAANQVVANAAVVTVGAVGQANLLAGVSSTDLIIDVIGYFPSTGVVTSLDSIPGDVTIAAGANITITPSGHTVTIAASVPAGPPGPPGPSLDLPPVGFFTATQIVKGAILTCTGTSSTATTASCSGMKLNGLDVRLGAPEATAICNAVTGLGFQSGNGVGTSAPDFLWNGSHWAISSTTASPLQNLTCNK